MLTWAAEWREGDFIKLNAETFTPRPGPRARAAQPYSAAAVREGSKDHKISLIELEGDFTIGMEEYLD